MRHIGFTGTRQGMSAAQWSLVSSIVASTAAVHGLVVAHHGDCIGADANFHDIAMHFGARIVGHPPRDESRQSGRAFHEARGPLPYMARNAAIVAESDVMIAAPAEMEEQPRGGTWATVRMTRKAGKPLAIVWPDGSVTRERWP